ncbi:MAG: cell division/cell wall cluster transcriptional repressor MraZ [Elusimicrobia bacterium]|nr:cell division/cell wall cluster transcriptional repressor MraZ [Elusimicrobiota bacterium]
MLINGKNIYKLDSKNRFSVHGALLKDGKHFHLTLGLDGCLFMYPEKEWKRIRGKLSLLNYASKDNRKFLRIFFAHACPVKADSHKRLLLPAALKEKCGIGKELLLIRIGQFYEIWPPEKFAEYENANTKTYAGYAEKLDIKL